MGGVGRLSLAVSFRGGLTSWGWATGPRSTGPPPPRPRWPLLFLRRSSIRGGGVIGQDETGESRVLSERHGKHLSAAQREELSYEAYELSIKRLSYREIAARLNVNKDTVTSLIREERSRRRIEYFGEILAAAGTYACVEREAWQRLSDAPPGSKPNLATVGLLNNIISARTRRDALLGLDAPRKSQVHQRIERFDFSRLSSAELEVVESALSKAEVREIEGGI
jgi:hypothetical protein